MVLENDTTKIVWDFQFNLWKTETAKRLTWYSKRNTRSRFGFVTSHVPCNKISLRNGEVSWRDIDNLLLRWQKDYRGYTDTTVPVITGTLGGGMKKTMNDLTKLLTKQELLVKTAAEMQKTIFMNSETLLREVFSVLLQSNTEENRLFSWYWGRYIFMAIEIP